MKEVDTEWIIIAVLILGAIGWWLGGVLARYQDRKGKP